MYNVSDVKRYNAQCSINLLNWHKYTESIGRVHMSNACSPPCISMYVLYGGNSFLQRPLLSFLLPISPLGGPLAHVSLYLWRNMKHWTLSRMLYEVWITIYYLRKLKVQDFIQIIKNVCNSVINIPIFSDLMKRGVNVLLSRSFCRPSFDWNCVFIHLVFLFCCPVTGGDMFLQV